MVGLIGDRAVPSPDALAQLTEGPVFVVGHMRSGTTWVYETLTAHPAVAGAFETWLFTQRGGLSGLFHSAHWDAEEVRRGERFTGHVVGLTQLLARDDLLQDVRSLTGRWLARRLEPHHRFLVEKTPRHLVTLPLIAELYPQARFVHVQRDGRDVVVSKRAVATGWARPGLPLHRSVYREARNWAEDLARVRASAPLLGERLLEVRYEELVSDPLAGARRLFEFCRIPCDGDTLQAAVAAARLDVDAAGEGRFRRAGRVGDWVSGLGPLDALLFDLAAGPALVDAGYARRRLLWALRRPRVAHKPQPA